MLEPNFYKPMLLFHIVVSICSLIFIVGVFLKLKIVFSGRASNPGLKTHSILRSLLRDSLFQIPLLKLSFYRWITHMFIFWGFTGLFIGTTRLFIYTDIWKNEMVLFGQDISCDISGIMLFAGVVLAFFRRLFLRNVSTLTEFEDATLLIFLLILDVSGFLVEGARIALTHGNIEEQSFVGIWLSVFMKGISPLTATVLWTLHSLASALFIAYVPFSKLWHTFTAPAVLAMNPEKYPGD